MTVLIPDVLQSLAHPMPLRTIPLYRQDPLTTIGGGRLFVLGKANRLSRLRICYRRKGRVRGLLNQRGGGSCLGIAQKRGFQ